MSLRICNLEKNGLLSSGQDSIVGVFEVIISKSVTHLADRSFFFIRSFVAKPTINRLGIVDAINNASNNNLCENLLLPVVIMSNNSGSNEQEAEGYSQDSDFDSSIFSYDSESEHSEEEEGVHENKDSERTGVVENPSFVPPISIAFGEMRIDQKDSTANLSAVEEGEEKSVEEEGEMSVEDQNNVDSEQASNTSTQEDFHDSFESPPLSHRCQDSEKDSTNSNFKVERGIPQDNSQPEIFNCVQDRGRNERRLSNFIIKQDPNNLQLPSPPSRVITYSTSRLEQLSLPRRLQHRRGEETEFFSRTKKINPRDYKEFIARQELHEKNRRMKLERKKMAVEYEAKPTKRRCPTCGNVQTFDEFITNRTTCPIDGTEYTLPRTFNLRRFERRMFQSSCKKLEDIDMIRKEREDVLMRAKTRTQEKSLSQRMMMKQANDDFLQRMADDLARRKRNIQRLVQTSRAEEIKRYSFKPFVARRIAK